MADERKAFGDRVRVCRKAAGFTQEEFADRAGLDISYISQIERGHRDPTLGTVRKLAAALRLSPVDLLGGPGGAGQLDVPDAVLRDIVRILSARSPADRRKARKLLRVVFDLEKI